MVDPTKKTAVAFGATGMLFEALIHLANSNERVLSFSRGETKKKLANNIVPINVDFSDPKALQTIMTEIKGLSHIQSFLFWVHSQNHRLVLNILEQLNPEFDGRVVQVFGTSTSPSRMSPLDFKDKFPNLDYVSVMLGSKRGRWLTNREISDGAISALRTGRDINVGN